MATQSDRTKRPAFFSDAKSAESLRRQFIEAPLEASRQSALDSALELGDLLSILPAAFVASQERELKRVRNSGIENDPRAAALELSIEQVGALQTMTQSGKLRIERALAAAANKDHVFHGFVSNSDLTPCKGLTVRLTGIKATRSKTLSTTTDEDGYFSVALGPKDYQEPDAKAGGVSLSQRIINLMTSPVIPPGPSSSGTAKEDASQVEILKKGKLLYSDPAPLARDEGSVYREYFIDDTKLSSSSDLRKFTSGVSSKGAARKVDQPKGATDASQGTTASSSSTDTPANPRTSRKSARHAKSKQPKEMK